MNPTANPSEIKLELFRYIDNLTIEKLEQFYNLLIVKHQENESTDFWESLSDWEKNDINAGISDIDNGRFKEIEQVLSKYQ
jgi:hypothetical protein